jgi:hypothetical protein
MCGGLLSDPEGKAGGTYLKKGFSHACLAGLDRAGGLLP